MCAAHTFCTWNGMEWNEGLIFLYLLALSVLSLPLHLLNYSFPFHFVFELRIDAAGCVFPVLSETLLFGCLVGRSQSIFAISVGAIHSVPAFIHSRTAHMTRRLKWRILPFVRMMLIFLLFWIRSLSTLFILLFCFLIHFQRAPPHDILAEQTLSQ